MEFPCTLIKEFRQMPPGHKMDCAYPWLEFLYSTEPLFHKPPVSVAIAGVAVIYLDGTETIFLSKPIRVTSIYPQDNKIYIHCFVLYFRCLKNSILTCHAFIASLARLKWGDDIIETHKTTITPISKTKARVFDFHAKTALLSHPRSEYFFTEGTPCFLRLR